MSNVDAVKCKEAWVIVSFLFLLIIIVFKSIFMLIFYCSTIIQGYKNAREDKAIVRRYSVHFIALIE